MGCAYNTCLFDSVGLSELLSVQEWPSEHLSGRMRCSPLNLCNNDGTVYTCSVLAAWPDLGG